MKKRKKRKAGKIIAFILFLLLVALLALMPAVAKEAEELSPASILTDTAQYRELVRTVYGGGALSSGEPVEETVINSVVITELYVHSGDIVSAGDALAAVDKVSVMSAISAVQQYSEALAKAISSMNLQYGDITLQNDGTVLVNGSKIKTDKIPEYVKLLALTEQHRWYGEMLSELFTIYGSGVITADSAGIINGLDRDILSKNSEKRERTLDYPLDRAGGWTQSAEKKTFMADNCYKLCDIVPLETMCVTVSLDEKDVPYIYVGMPAGLSVDALPGQSFEATVKAISKFGSTTKGSSKFDVELELPYSEGMLPGMNAVVSLITGRFPERLTLPVAALVDMGSGTCVYTAYDSESGQLLLPVKVKTGVSDGEYVEIASGLPAGAVVWYEYYDKYEISYSAETLYNTV